jgi:DNA-binding CsgD family transcriptional regulator
MGAVKSVQGEVFVKQLALSEPQHRNALLSELSDLLCRRLEPTNEVPAGGDGFEPDVRVAITLPRSEGSVQEVNVVETVRHARFVLITAQSGELNISNNDASTSERIVLRRVDSARESSRPETRGRDSLTERQKEVLRLIASGATAREVANRLGISVRTAEFHRMSIMQRLDLHSTAELTRYALKERILD